MKKYSEVEKIVLDTVSAIVKLREKTKHTKIPEPVKIDSKTSFARVSLDNLETLTLILTLESGLNISLYDQYTSLLTKPKDYGIKQFAKDLHKEYLQQVLK